MTVRLSCRPTSSTLGEFGTASALDVALTAVKVDQLTIYRPGATKTYGSGSPMAEFAIPDDASLVKGSYVTIASLPLAEGTWALMGKSDVGSANEAIICRLYVGSANPDRTDSSGIGAVVLPFQASVTVSTATSGRLRCYHNTSDASKMYNSRLAAFRVGTLHVVTI